jgi:hypothetical protein
MAQNLPDLAQARAGAQHLGRGGVPQAVRTDLGEPCPLAGAMHDPVQRRGVQPHVGRPGPGEEEPAVTFRSPGAQPVDDRLPNVDGQR